MQRKTKTAIIGLILLGIATVLTWIIWAGTLPSNICQALALFDKILNVLTHEELRWSCFAVFIGLWLLSCWLYMYPPDTRREVAAKRILGAYANDAPLALPLLKMGWQTKSGDEPKAENITGVPGFYAVLHVKESIELDYEFPTANELGRYVHIVANRLGQKGGGHSFWGPRAWGCLPHLRIKVKKKQEGSPIIVSTVYINSGQSTRRLPNSDNCTIDATEYVDHFGYDNILVDLEDIRRAYPGETYEFLGVSGVHLAIADSALIAHV